MARAAPGLFGGHRHVRERAQEDEQVGKSAKSAAFRPEAGGGVAAARPSHRQATCLLLALALVAGAVAVVSFLVKPDDARTFDMFRGSVFLADQVAPVAVDLATGRPTVRLVDANRQVGAERADDLAVVPTSDGTLLLNRDTGEFNMVESTGFVVKNDGGVPLPRRQGSTTAFAVAAQNFAYIAQTGPTGTSAYAVNGATVQAVAGSTGTAKPRAFRSMPEPVSTAPGASAAAGDDLWLLAGSGDRRVVRQLSLRPGSAPGSTLALRDVGSVAGPAALATSGDAAGLASSDRILVYRGERRLADVRYPALAGLDTVLPAGGDSGRLAWLLHGSAGWASVSIGADGHGLQGPTPVADIPADTQIVPPVTSGGRLYTVDARSGALLEIDRAGAARRVAGMSSYPVVSQAGRTIEAASFSDTTLFARGPRVIVNSPNHLLAVAVFTDGSREPMRIEKSSAINVSAGGGAEALARRRAGDNPTPPKRGDTKPVPQPVQPVNTTVDCTATSQQPHIPAFGQPVPGSRSVQLQWTYPITNRTDCVPTTYVVQVETLSGSSPSAPASVTVQGQQGVNLTGLFPSTRYRLTVVAYLNGRGTTSTPIEVTTGPEGPAAPSDVTAGTDGAGNWTIGWRSCGSVANGCVPSDTWRVVPQFCDGRGLSGTLDPIEVAADPTSRVQPGATLAAGSALLGRGLRFQVEGIGTDGAIGTPSGSTACVTSWAPPNASAMRLVASKPTDAAAGSTTSTTLSLSLGTDPVTAVGGVGATVTFSLTGPGGTQTRSVVVDGRSATLTQTFPGVRPGANYTATARVGPPGHPEAAVSLDAGAVVGRATWPTPTVDASCSKDSLLSCTLRVRIGGVSSASSGGELFDLTADSALTCGQTTSPLSASRFDPAAGVVVTKTLLQTDFYFGQCAVRVGLTEAAGTAAPLYYGGTVSPGASTQVDLGAPATAGLSKDNFTATWGDTSAAVTYDGTNQDAVATMTAQVIAPNGTACKAPVTFSRSTDVDAGECVSQYGDLDTGWQVRFVYTDATDGDSHSVLVDLTGRPTGYRFCTPDDFTAQWGLLKANGVVVDNGTGVIGGCSDWKYALTAPGDTDACATGNGAPPATIDYAGTCGAAPSRDDWSVVITWTRPNGTTGTQTVTVSGDPPVA